MELLAKACEQPEMADAVIHLPRCRSKRLAPLSCDEIAPNREFPNLQLNGREIRSAAFWREDQKKRGMLTLETRPQTDDLSSLRKRREETGMSMTQLAQKAGLALSMISFVERELRKPTLETLLRIAVALDVDLGALLQRARKAAKGTGDA